MTACLYYRHIYDHSISTLLKSSHPILPSPSHHHHTNNIITPILQSLPQPVRFGRSSCPDGRATTPTRRPLRLSRRKVRLWASSKTPGNSSDRDRGAMTAGAVATLSPSSQLPYPRRTPALISLLHFLSV